MSVCKAAIRARRRAKQDTRYTKVSAVVAMQRQETKDRRERERTFRKTRK
jgi:hypothetical protein